MTIESLINHLWQSSAIVLFAGLLALLLRNGPPKVRYWIWLSASLKFLLPLSLLMSLGSMLPRPTPLTTVTAAPVPVLTGAIVEIATPYSAPARTTTYWVSGAIGIAWMLGFVIIAFMRCRAWLRIRKTLQSATSIDLPIPIPALIAPNATEPGIVGFLKPALILPPDLLNNLSTSELNALLAHEMSHVRRRDNLFAAIHMSIEAIFWFNPLVWWIGSRMIEERERACDEAVLQTGCEPTDYVEGILKVARLYKESPLPCIAGVTGADVKKRILAILSENIARELTTAKKLALATAALAILATPIAIGILTAPVVRAQIAPANTPKFEAASIKPCQEPVNNGSVHSTPGRLRTDCADLLNIIGNAYNAFADGHLNPDNEQAPVNGGPPWIHSAAYDIQATAEGNQPVPMMLGPMMQKLLEDRFQLKIHRETTEGSVYFLTVAHGGPKLHPFTEGSCTPYWGFPKPPLQPGTNKYCERTIYGLNPAVEADGATLDEFSKTLRVLLDRPVIDKTGITGRFDIRVEFSREATTLESMRLNPPPAPDPTGRPTIFTAIQEQIGLKLESGKGPVQVLVIDHIEKPTEN